MKTTKKKRAARKAVNTTPLDEIAVLAETVASEHDSV